MNKNNSIYQELFKKIQKNITFLGKVTPIYDILLATTNSAKALYSALGCWLTWACQFKLFFILLTTDSNTDKTN